MRRRSFLATVAAGLFTRGLRASRAVPPFKPRPGYQFSLAELRVTCTMPGSWTLKQVSYEELAKDEVFRGAGGTFTYPAKLGAT